MPNLVQGRIVYANKAIPDPQGRNPKAGRPFVVVSTPDEIAAGDDLHLVGITEDYGNNNPDDIKLPHGPNCHTGLTKPSVALCTWKADVAQDEVTFDIRYVRPQQLQQILERLATLKST